MAIFVTPAMMRQRPRASCKSIARTFMPSCGMRRAKSYLGHCIGPASAACLPTLASTFSSDGRRFPKPYAACLPGQTVAHLKTATSMTSGVPSSSKSESVTTAVAFLEAIWDAGITHCFVNLGTDHPAIIEAMIRGKREANGKFPRILTCPNEMVALSMADGFARLSGIPQCVIVHVDVGTQGLSAAMHNASTGRAPVLILAGLSPITMEGEMLGSRSEYVHWMQDVPDQKQIVAQYCRYTGEIKTGENVKQMVNRALQFATSDPQGPAYLCAAREVLEADIAPYSLKQENWRPVQLGGLPQRDADHIARILADAERPLVITSYSGRNHKFPCALVELAHKIPGLRVLDAGGCYMCFPADHPAWRGLRFGVDDIIPNADAILVIDCDVPWIPTRCKPNPSATVFHIDVDPLKQQMPLAYIEAVSRYRADALISVEQISAALDHPKSKVKHKARQAMDHAAKVLKEHSELLSSIAEKAKPLEDGRFGSGFLCQMLKRLCPKDTIWAVEAVTNTNFVHENLQPTKPGSWINCGGGLGWSGGGALGVKLATDAANCGKGKFVVQIVGDGTFLFTVPSSVYWISKRYKIPVLAIVLNNEGWQAPRRSLLLLHPHGLASQAINEEANISLAPVPDFAGIAKAAADGDIFAAKVRQALDLEEILKNAIAQVQGGRSAVVDCEVAPDC